MNRVELVTLSAREAGLTDPKSERDVFGISRPLLFAGAKKVMAPLWQIEDEAAGNFMQAFYRGYAEKRSAVSSLGNAQAALIRSEKYRHPHYWSGFVLQGGLQ
jgi:CHAT domain-containing protein